MRPRQRLLLGAALPRFSFRPKDADEPSAAFGPPIRELWVEIGAGGGEHAVEIAAANPAAGLIACEVYENGVCSLLSRLIPEGREADAAPPGNLRIWHEDGRALLRLLPDASVDRLFLLFPDPWPKARHAKRRFVHPAALPEVARVLRAGAEWRVASDDPTYQAWVEEVMGAQAFFETAPSLSTRPVGWPPTRYEAKALRAGRSPAYWNFVRRPKLGAIPFPSCSRLSRASTPFSVRDKGVDGRDKHGHDDGVSEK